MSFSTRESPGTVRMGDSLRAEITIALDGVATTKTFSLNFDPEKWVTHPDFPNRFTGEGNFEDFKYQMQKCSTEVLRHLLFEKYGAF